MAYVVPMVHLNGTSRQSLIEQQKEIRSAAIVLLTALAGATPHDRDYYPLGDGVGKQAREFHRAKMLAVKEIAEEAEKLALDIMDEKGNKQ